MIKNILIIFFIASSIFAQTENETNKRKIISALSESKDIYEKNKGFTFKIQNFVFESYSSDKVLELTTGKFSKYQDNYYFKVHDAEIVNINEYTIKTDASVRAMQVFQKNKEENKVYDLINLVKYYSKFNIEKSEKDIICTLEAEKVSVSPYGKIIIYIDKESKLITKQIMFLYTSIQFKNKDYIPRIEMIFSNFSLLKVNPDELKLDKYIKKINSTFSPSSFYKDYNLIK